MEVTALDTEVYSALLENVHCVRDTVSSQLLVRRS